MNGRALVTGAAGFIGSHLSERLLREGCQVVGVDSLTDYYDVRIKRENLAALLGRTGFSFVEGCLTKMDLGPLLAGVDLVFHQAAQPGVRASWGRNFEYYLNDNVMATQKLLEAAREASIKRFIYASSSSVYGEAASLPMGEDHPTRPVSPYGVTKLSAENLCLLYRRNFGLPVIALRYFTVYGPRQRPDMAIHRFIKAALEGKPVEIYGDGQQTRDFTFVADVVEANILARDYQGDTEVFNVGGGSRVALSLVVDLVGKLCSGRLEVVFRDRFRGDVTHTFADIGRAQAELGYIPKTSMEEGIGAEVDWVKHLHRKLGLYQGGKQ